MRIIYKLPQYLAVIALIGIAIEIYPYIKMECAADILTQYKYKTMAENTLVMATGVNLYTILNTVAWLFVLVLAILRCDLIKVKVRGAVVVVIVLFLQVYFTIIVMHAIENLFSDIGFSVITMKGQYVYGTVPFTLLLAFILAKAMKKNIGTILDYIAPLWLINLVFVRLACFTAGCCGVETCNIMGINLVLPAQLIEAALTLVLLQIILNIERNRSKDEKIRFKEGSSFFIVLGIYAMFRFLIDFMRDVPDIFLGMIYAQIYSLFCIVVSISVLAKLKD